MSLCIIVGGADYCRLPDIIPEDAYIIACDSGYDRCMELEVKPHLLIGDMDSIKSPLPKDIRVIKAPCEKDDTDTMLAIKTAFEKGYTSFILTGVTGGCRRMSHTLAALSALEYICDHNGHGCAMDIFNRYYVQGVGTAKYPYAEVMAEDIPESGDMFPFEYISVFSLTDSSEISMRGFKYGGEHMTVERGFPIGVSNEFKERFGEIRVFGGKILVILES